MNPSILYVSFDVVPFPKGAAVHIQQFSRGILERFGSLHLATLSPNDDLIESSLGGIKHIQIPAPGSDLITRVMNFRRMLKAWLSRQARPFDVIQFRSPFEGLPIVEDKQHYCRSIIFEVNGLPSVELKYRYPAVATDDVLLDKLYSQEQSCLNAADLVVTTCGLTSGFLQARGVEANKIRVIPNGVDLEIFRYSPLPTFRTESHLRLIYFGTLSAWQGVDIALRALAGAKHEINATITIVGASTEQQRKRVLDLAAKLGIEDRVSLLNALPQHELVDQIHRSHVVLAPLTNNDRNLVQGCCPLKVLETMATGRPVIASDIQVVHEIAPPDTVIFAKCGSINSLKEKIIEVHLNYGGMIELVEKARRTIETHYTWERANSQLIACFEDLLNKESSVAFKS